MCATLLRYIATRISIEEHARLLNKSYWVMHALRCGGYMSSDGRVGTIQ
jgi:hypothetical protein